ncbi:MAG: phosphoribosylformylglycinamidine cyclo-ligase [Acidobacteriota bacterium]
MSESAKDPQAHDAYRQAGVDIDAQDRALEEVKVLARGTFTPGVLTEVGSFGGLFRPDLNGLEEPVLVSSADGVGTKLMVSAMVGDYSTVGHDLVNHCVNDILVQGARPLFFMDYVGAGVLDPSKVVDLVRGVSAGCRENGCALLGGETAEMPGFYRPGDYELVGFIVGLADRQNLLDGSRVQVGDTLIALPSAGLHTNGYSLARRVFFEILGLSVESPLPGGDSTVGRRTVGQELLAPHLSYLDCISPLLGDEALHAMAHITGGGLTDNLPRSLPDGARAVVDLDSWQVPEVFQLLVGAGRVSGEEAFRVFNMGVGMVLFVAASEQERVLAHLRSMGTAPWVLGSVEQGADGEAVVYRGGSGAGH